MLKGIAASSGIAIAKVYKLQQPVLNIEMLQRGGSREVPGCPGQDAGGY